MDSQAQSESKSSGLDWERRLQHAGLSQLAEALAEAFKPIAPLAAQLLWFTQPGFALFGQSDAIDALASRLADGGASDSNDTHASDDHA